MEDINRILVVARSTKYCHKAVHYGVSLARKYGAELSVLHVIHNPFGMEGWNLPLAYLPDLEEEFNRMCTTAKKDLDKIIAMEKANGLPIKEMIVEGDPMKKLFQVVEQEKIDLLIMIAYQQWLLEHWLFGRELDEIVRKMPCSVLLVQKKIGVDELGAMHSGGETEPAR
jgi:nucleotide-binding universal stress UspA family protein